MRTLLCVVALLLATVAPAQTWKLEVVTDRGKVEGTAWAYHYSRNGMLWLATSGHAMAHGRPILSIIRETPGGPGYLADCVSTETEPVDVSVLCAVTGPKPIYHLGQSTDQEERVRAFGFVANTKGLWAPAEVAGEYTMWMMDDEPDYKVVTSSLGPGASGGPVLNAEGEAVGILSALLPCDLGNYNLFVPINQVGRWMFHHGLLPKQLRERYG